MVLERTLESISVKYFDHVLSTSLLPPLGRGVQVDYESWDAIDHRIGNVCEVGIEGKCSEIGGVMSR